MYKVAVLEYYHLLLEGCHDLKQGMRYSSKVLMPLVRLALDLRLKDFDIDAETDNTHHGECFSTCDQSITPSMVNLPRRYLKK